jgi:hypothetical protein
MADERDAVVGTERTLDEPDMAEFGHVAEGIGPGQELVQAQAHEEAAGGVRVEQQA